MNLDAIRDCGLDDFHEIAVFKLFSLIEEKEGTVNVAKFEVSSLQACVPYSSDELGCLLELEGLACLITLLNPTTLFLELNHALWFNVHP